jgi:transglutaminase-like putative cysteine protease
VRWGRKTTGSSFEDSQMPKGENYMKRVLTLLTLTLIIMTLSAISFADGGIIKVNEEIGTVSINYTATDYSDFKVLVKKGTEQYVYNLYDSQEEFPLQMGSGEYSIGLYQRVDGNKYRKVTSTKAVVTIDMMKVYTASIQTINWKENTSAAKLAESITTEKMTDQEKFNAIYKYVINNVVYDYKKASSVDSRFIPNNTLTIENKNGICYDYSSLMASMLRSVGVPSKMIHGQSTYTSVYHAWNEVYLNGKWVIIDSTIDAQLSKGTAKYAVEKSVNDYVGVKSF